jgi:phytoene dehydrogenase-like protein
MAYLDAAYEDSRAGRYSRRPYLDVVIPSLSDPSVAPPGKHLMSCFVQYAPYELADGSWDDHRDGLGNAVIDALAEYAPNMRSIVTARQVVTPLDLEREWGLTEGQIFQGEMTPDQIFFMRPAPGWARYATPVPGLYMCGAATHPGGGVMGAPGRNAARTILRAGRPQ